MSKEEIISQSVLVNGMKIIHRRRAGELSHIALMVNVGMRDELEDENGLAHFIEHLIFKGTKHRKAYHILSCLENVGGVLKNTLKHLSRFFVQNQAKTEGIY